MSATPDWSRIRAIFDEVADAPLAGREERVDRLCGGDGALRREVLALLEAQGRTGSFLDRPAIASPAALDALASGGTAGDPLIGTMIGGFTILSRLGEGGMGTVYRATQDRPRRTVALKVIRSPFASAALLRRFEHESQILGRLRHPGIAQVFEAGSLRGANGHTTPYFAMELVEGVPLMAFAETHGLSTRERVDLVALVCDAVEHAHQKGIIHRDLKPANILVEAAEQTPTGSRAARDGRSELSGGTGSPVAGGGSGCAWYRPRVLDFGVARATGAESPVTTMRTDAGQLIGTLQYMSPEQVRGDSHDADTRSDVYALGVILFELLTGRPPVDVRGRPVPEAARLIVETPAPAAGSVDRSLRGDLETIVAKALEKDPVRRYQSAAALAGDLRRYLAGEPIAARPPSATYLLSRLIQRHRTVAGLLGVLVAGSLAFGVTMAWLWGVAEARRADAEAARGESVASAARATREAEAARVVAAFMGDVFARARPKQPGDADLSAVALLDEATRKLSQRRPATPEVAAALYLAIAHAYDGLGQPEKSREFLLLAKPLVEERVGRQTLTYATLVSDLAETARRLGLWDDARAHIREFAGLQETLLSTAPAGDHVFTDAPAMLAWEIGDLDAAEPMMRDALARARAAGGGPTAMARHQSNYAGVLVEMGRLAEAESLMREAVGAWRESTNPLSKTMLGSGLNNLAWTLHQQGRWAEAEPLARESVELQGSIFGPQHAATASARTTLGAVLCARGDLSGAIPMLMHALAVRERVLPLASDQTSETRLLLARALAAARDFASARVVLEAGLPLPDSSPRGRRARVALLEALLPILDALGDSAARAAAEGQLDAARRALDAPPTTSASPAHAAEGT